MGRSTPDRCAVVAQRDVAADFLLERFPGWTVLHPCDLVPNARFDQIVVLMSGRPPMTQADYEKEAVWLNDLRARLLKGGSFSVMAWSR